MKWRARPGMEALLAALGAADGDTRLVGGFVRDSLLGIAAKDVDMATRLRPEAVLERLEQAGIRAVPTGIAHGTVMAVLESGPVEITTLRRDVTTNGRHATVAFSEDWQEDAARRDFTINALFADPMTGEVIDFFGGLSDLDARHVRFIGHAAERIREDHLRILRYFRFLARFGAPDAKAEDYQACIDQAHSLMALSRERIADELLKLLATDDPAPALMLMIAGGIFTPVLPEIDEDGLSRVKALILRERGAGLAPSGLRRLIALGPQAPVAADQIATRLKLSTKARKRIAAALAPDPVCRDAIELAYRVGVESAVDRILLTPAQPACELEALKNWTKPNLPVSGRTLIELGLSPGPIVAKTLKDVEESWIAEGFPDADRAYQIAVASVSRTLRDSQ